MNYRKDIDGLRGIAIFLVLGYHAFPSLISGGFVGVDVFFVISGFLITSILKNDLETENFSMVRFWGRRIRRIFPALVFVLSFCFVVGWMLLTKVEFRELSKYIFSGASFATNIALWKGDWQTGYFQGFKLDVTPVLHLWSLGIEEQFYIVWPVVLYLVWRSRFNPFFTTVVIALVSFLLNIFLVEKFPNAVFYCPATRFWEILIGASLAFSPSVAFFRGDFFLKIKQSLTIYRRSGDSQGGLRDFSAVLGFCLIMMASFFLDKDSKFPSWAALLPTLGALLIILAGPEAWLNRRIISNRFLLWLGSISYPLYLWHWPLLSFGHIAASKAPTSFEKMGLICTSVVLAWFTYRFIEIPVKTGFAKTNSRAWTLALVASMGFVGIVSVAKYLEMLHLSPLERNPAFSNFNFLEGSGRLTPKYSKLYRSECDYKLMGGEVDPSCIQHQVSGKHIFLWGDSHAQALGPGLRNFFANESVVFSQIGGTGCGPETKFNDSLCADATRFALDMIEDSHPDVVILGKSGAYDYTNLKSLLRRLNLLNTKVIVVGPVPHWDTDLFKLLARHLVFSGEMALRLPLGTRPIFTDDSNLNKFVKQNSTVTYVSVVASLCNSDGCLTRVGEAMPEDLLTFDLAHLTENASKYVAAEILGPVVKQTLFGDKVPPDAFVK
jgi:peptidoglycan/LPS O-acetylase OafA/YrhL